MTKRDFNAGLPGDGRVSKLDDLLDSFLRSCRPEVELATLPASLVERLRELPSTLEQSATVAANEPKPPIPSRIGVYEIKGPIRSGGMGDVYRARHSLLDCEVALKVLPCHLASSAVFVERFRREMRLLAAVDHPNVIRALDADEHEGILFLAMELVNGIDLKELAQNQPLSIQTCCDLIRQTALGLDAMHRQGVVHRDVKPSNIMLTSQGVVKLLDFGLAVGIDERSELASEWLAFGTNNYMSPEQQAGNCELDCRSDIYSLGRTLQSLLSSSMGVESIEEAHQLGKRLPRGMAKLLDEMLAAEPNRRLSSTAEVAKRLEDIVAAENHCMTSRGHHSVMKWLTVAGIVTLLVMAASAFVWVKSVPAERRPKTQAESLSTTAVAPPDSSDTIGRYNSAREREIALIIVSQGGTVSVNTREMNSRYVDAAAPSELPNAPFVVQKVTITRLPGGLEDCRRIRELTNLQGLFVLTGEVHVNPTLCLNPVWKLKWLYLAGRQLDDESLGSLRPYQRSLENLDISDSLVTDAGLEVLSQFTQLREIQLRRTSITDAGIAGLLKMPSLVSLDLSGTRITDRALQSFASGKRLRKLQLAGTSITDEGFAALTHLPLVELNVKDTKVTPAALDQFKKHHPRCFLHH